jgi:HK97 family phage prohead protease/HK97 family phage major capsid protein
VTPPNIERRSVHARWELRDEPDGGIGLRGYAAVFDSEAHGEVIRSSAFTRTLEAGADVRLLIDHEGIPLARTTSGTMTLSVDEVGLVVDVPDLDMTSPRVQTVVSALRRGDLSQMSFAFAPVEESFDSDRRVRELLDVDLFDVSVVAYPWYEATTVEVNSTPSLVEIRSTDADDPDDDDEDDGDVPDDDEDESENTQPTRESGDSRMSDDIRESAEVRSEDATVAESRIADLEGRAALEDRIAALESRSAGAAEKRAYDEVARVTRDERTYNPDADRRGQSFLSDVVARFTGDFDAAQRLSRHMVEERTERGAGIESRAVGTAAFGALVVPQYLTDLVAPVARAGRPTADICNRMALPPEGMTVEIPRITTGTTVAVQATQNTAVSETNLDETTLSVPVVTIAGQQTVSIQAISRGRGVEQVVVRDLVSAYNTLLDQQIVEGAAGTGEHRGILATANIKSVSFTDTSPTAAELYPKLFDLIQQIQSSVYRGVTHFIMHPRRWAWMAAQVGTTFPFLQAASNPQGAAGQFGAPSYGGVVGNIAGVPVVLDANISITTSTTQDTIYAVSADELHLWEESGSPLYVRAEQPKATALGVQLVVYGFSAFTAGRYPGAHGKISGAGLTTTTF